MSDSHYKVNLLQIHHVTHNVKRLVCSKPRDFQFTEGQAVELSIDSQEWKDESRPFTMTSTPNDAILEFTTKIYASHEGVTRQIDSLSVSDTLCLSKPFGAIKYDGPGVFIAGGAGVTPFISILRSCKQNHQNHDNTLIFTNKSSRDVILEHELEYLTNNKLICLFTQKPPDGESSQRIDKSYLKNTIADYDQCFYVCGPPGFVKDISCYLKELGANPSSITFEQ